MRKLVQLCLVILSTAAIGFSVQAQTTQASIYGIVLDQNAILPGVEVILRNESTGFTTRTRTNASGEYLFKELPLGGPYSLSVMNSLGEPVKKSGFYLNQGDASFVDLNINETETTLDAIVIEGTSLKNRREFLGAATAISERTIESLPVNGRNFTTLTDLSPLANGSSIGGQLGSSTNFTIDGMTAKNPTSAGSTTSRSGAPYSISMEAVREFKVVTNQYDVTLGRSGGGTVSAVTKSGTNTWSGSAFTFARADWLASPYDIRGNRRDSDYSTYQYGASLSGPIIKDKLHFFVAWDHQLDSRSLVIADIQTPADEDRFNISRKTLDRFVGIARDKYGVSNKPQYGVFDKKRGSDAAFLRLDWQIDHNHLLTIRNNFTSDRNPLGLGDNTSINLYESYGNDLNMDNSFLATLRSTLSPKLTNELKFQHLYVYQKSSPGDDLPEGNIPRAIVENVVSDINGTNRSTNIQIGGHRFAQEGFKNNIFQLVNNLYYNTDNIKYTFGADIMQTRSSSVYGSEVNGRFHFKEDTATGRDAMQSFESLSPYRFYREVPLVDDLSVQGNILNVGLYGQMQFKLATGLDVTAGLRMDYAHYPTAQYNDLVFKELGLRTDNKFKSLIVQPRLQLNWDANENGSDIFRFGAGIFGSDINNYALINNLTFDGNHLATVDVRAADLPSLDFNGYRSGNTPLPNVPAQQLASINLTGDNAKVPVIYKTNLSYTHFFSNQFRIGVAGYVSLTRNNYTYVDRNMVANPFFKLANEDHRGVFVPLDKMPSNGAADWKDGRISDKLGRVLELTSDGKVNQFAFVIDANYNYYKDGEITASYTWNDTKDNTSYNGNVANTATLVLPVKDDPRDLSKMTYSDNHFRHKVVLYGTLPTFAGVSIGVRFSGIAGTRYSLLSGGNTNGDFVSGTNDLAYIFDRKDPSVPENLRTSLQGILDNPEVSPSLKNYIEKYSGSMAERNGGINGFFGLVDLRVSKKFKLYNQHQFELSADFFNLANMLNKDWGVNESMGTHALYALGLPESNGKPAVPAFSPENQQFNYRVNTAGKALPSGNPYQIQVGLRYLF